VRFTRRHGDVRRGHVRRTDRRVYDRWTSVTQRGDEQAAAAALAAGGPALELGIGTGRIALPLAAPGVAFHGVDASPAMVAQLRASQAAT
jgi:SAM-dependent methyltransferase